METTLAFPAAVAMAWCLWRGSERHERRNGRLFTWRAWLSRFSSGRTWHAWWLAAALLVVAGLPYLAWKLALWV